MNNYTIFRNIPVNAHLVVSARLSSGAKVGLVAQFEDENGVILPGRWTKADLVPGDASRKITASVCAVFSAVFQNTTPDTIQLCAGILDANGAVIRQSRCDIQLRGSKPRAARAYIDVIC